MGLTPAVRVLYAIPSDREFQGKYSEAVNHAVHHVQDWYAAQLDGYTFDIEGEIPQRCDLAGESGYYESTYGWARVIEDVQHCAPVAHWSKRNVWVVYVDAAYNCFLPGELGRGGAGLVIVHRGDLAGLANPNVYQLCNFPKRGTHGWIGGLAHEIGHAFGLEHPPGCDDKLRTCDEDAVMWLGFYHKYPERTYLTDADKQTLRESSFFDRRPTR